MKRLRSRRSVRLLWVLVVLLAALVVGLVLSKGSPPKPKTTTGALGSKLSQFSATGTVLAITQPQANGTLWVLEGSAGSKTVNLIDARTGAMLRSESVSPDAVDVAQSVNGVVLAVGTSGGAFPTIVFYNPPKASFIAAVKLAQPVTQLAVAPKGDIMYSLGGTGSATSVFAVNGLTRRGLTFPVNANTIDVARLPDGKGMWLALRNGQVEKLLFSSDSVAVKYRTGPSARSIAISPDGSTIYVLRRSVSSSAPSSVAVVNASTGSLEETIPTPSHCIDIALSLDGGTLYEATSTANGGSLRAAPL